MPDNQAVIVVDLQADFTELHHGALAVPGSDEEYLQKVIQESRRYAEQGHSLFATQDWHPPDHVSFARNHPGVREFETMEINGRSQVLWPAHCVHDSPGARLLLPPELFAAVVRKGSHPKHDSYSGFADDGGRRTDLEQLLRAAGMGRLLIYGLATDYCVKATAIDGRAAGFAVTVRLDLCRGVAPESTEEAVGAMRAAGVDLI